MNDLQEARELLQELNSSKGNIGNIGKKFIICYCV